MTSDVSDLILSLTPEDGSSIGNGAMLARLRDHIPTLTEEAYAEARDALIDDGTLGRGKGRGGIGLSGGCVGPRADGSGGQGTQSRHRQAQESQPQVE